MKLRPPFSWLGALALMWAAQAGAAPVSQPPILPKAYAAPGPALSAASAPSVLAPDSQSSARHAQADTTKATRRPVAGASDGAGEMIVHRGQRLSEALADFAKQQGWTVLWYCQDWAAPGQTIFHGDFMTVSQEFIKSISADGADIHGKWWLGNKTLVVTGSGAMQ
jgi:hypothetical protein